jgi:hypothetical protein
MRTTALHMVRTIHLRNELLAERLKRSMRRPGGRHVVFVLCASLLVGGASIWRWMTRPALKLRCPGGARPEGVVLGSTVAAGHGVMWSAVRLEGDTLTTKYLIDVRPDRALSAAEKEAFFERLEHPSALPRAFSTDAEGSIHVAYDCPGGVFHEEELKGAVTRRFSIDWLLRDPRAALGALDPRPPRVLAAALEVMGIAESIAGE